MNLKDVNKNIRNGTGTKIDWHRAREFLDQDGTKMQALADFRMDGKHIGPGQQVNTHFETAVQLIEERRAIPVAYLDSLRGGSRD